MTAKSLEPNHTRLSKPSKNALGLAILAFVLSAGFTFVYLKYLGPYLAHVVIPKLVVTSWSTPLASLIATWIGEAFPPLLLYFLIVRPFHLRPLLVTRTHPNWIRTSLMIFFALILFFVLTPLRTNSPIIVIILAIEFLGVGFAEEFSYRGVLTRVFRDRFGIIWAAVIVSVLFSLSHWAEWIFQEHFQYVAIGQQVITVFVFAILLTWIAWRSGTLWWAVFIHALNDFENQMSPAFQHSWTPLVILMICGIVGAEVLRWVSKPRGKSAIEI